MPAPSIAPADRRHDDITPADRYNCGDRVWVYDEGRWNPGFIEQLSVYASTIIYQTAIASRIDAIIRTAPYVARRHEKDHYVDLMAAHR